LAAVTSSSRAIVDLRTYVAALEEVGQLVRITRAVSGVHELADVAAALDRNDVGAGLFEHVIGSPWPILAGAVASHRRAAVALGCRPGEIIERMGHALDVANGVATVPVTDAPWQANTLVGDQIDIGRLPIPTHSRGDGGPFITGAVSVTKDPVSGRGNLSYNRMLRIDRTTLGFNVNEWRDVGTFMKSRGDPLAPFPVALAIGLDPAIMIAAGVRTPVDELLIAGALRGQGVEVCRGVTVEINIPARAEVVIEGHIRPAERRPEGPLAEFHGYHGEEWNSPTVEVSAISWCDDPIYQTIIPGWYEHIYIGNVLPREPLLRSFIRHVDPQADVHIPPYGNGFLAVIQIERDNPGTPKNLVLAAMTAHINIRNVVVVDRDIDIYDPAEVLWAVTNRVDWGRDVFTVPGAQGHEMDPTADQRGISTKLGIDATYKRERREYGARVSYPPIDLSPYLSGGR
jgi:2,5-furandicarboxylate decarboxylase 1